MMHKLFNQKTEERFKIVLILLMAMHFNMHAQSVGGITSGSTIFCDTLNSGFISLNSYTGTIIKWQSSANNGSTWTNIPNTAATQSYNNLATTTWFRAIVKNGSFAEDTSTVSKITVHIKGTTGTLSGGGTFCGSSGNGTITLSGTTGTVVYWQYSTNSGLSWNTIFSTASSLTHTNVFQNTLYRVIIKSDTVCADDTSTIAALLINPVTIAGNLLGSDSVCYMVNTDTIKLTANTGTIVNWLTSVNGGTWSILPNTLTTLTYSNISKSTRYKVVVKSGICPADTSNAVELTVYNANPASAGPDKEITRFDNVMLNGNGNGTPEWNPPAGLSSNIIFTPLASPLYSTEYILTLRDSHNCVSYDTVIVKVIIPIPTAITPNGDGQNDYFLIEGIEEFSDNAITIYNRWGNIVYTSAPYKNDWNGITNNGKDLPDDTYFYILDKGDGTETITGYILINR